jgi:hypothetical protein
MLKIYYQLVILLCIIPSFAIGATGDLQVTCEPDVKIYIDNEYKGITNEFEDGLAIELSSGKHTLKAVKKGYEPFIKEFTIQEYKGTKIEVTFKEVSENIYQISPESGETSAQVGTIELRSIPMGAIVYIDGEKKQGKTDMGIKGVKAGQHKILFQKGENNLSGVFKLEPSNILKLKADFKEGKIINISSIEKTEREKQREIEKAKLEREREMEKQRLEAEKLKQERLNMVRKYNSISFIVGWQEDAGFEPTCPSPGGKPAIYERTNYVIQDLDYGNRKFTKGKISDSIFSLGKCASGPCAEESPFSFSYIDETNKTDVFKITVIQEQDEGTSFTKPQKFIVEWCINSKCKTSQSNQKLLNNQINFDRYNLRIGCPGITIFGSNNRGYEWCTLQINRNDL